MNLIGDVAGQYDSVVRLLAKMPKERTVFLGDLVDRGPKSREVVELVRKNHECVLGNHEHLMVEWVDGRERYGNTWLANGGNRTLESYGVNPFDERASEQMIDDANWMRKLPLFIETDHVFASHAPWGAYESLELVTTLWLPPAGFSLEERPNGRSLIWNRRNPMARRFKDADGLSVHPFGKIKLQVFGHNPEPEVQEFEYVDDDGNEILFAMGIDCSCARVTTGLHVDDETGAVLVYQEAY